MTSPDRMRRVEAILFDAGNTLVYMDPVRLVGVLEPVGGETDIERIRVAELEARRTLHDAVREGHVGTEPEVWRGYFLELFRRCGVAPEAMEEAGRRLRDAHADDHLWTGVVPGTDRVLEELSRRGFRMGVISNADGRIEALLRDLALRTRFEFVIDSEVVGVEKPDPAIFLEGCRRMALPPGRCLYVGDLYPVDYVGARSAGLEAVLLDPLELYDGRAATVGSLAELPSFLSGGGG